MAAASRGVGGGEAAPDGAHVVSFRARLAGRTGDADAELIERAQAGDLYAYEDLVRRYQALGYRAAATIVGATDAEDVAQEAFVKAFHALGSFRPGAAFRPWLLTIVANEARNKRRSVGRYLAAVRRAAGQRLPEAPPADDRLVRLERRETLLAAVRSLPENERVAVHCRYLLELTEAETAALLGVPAGTVKSRLARGIARLRQLTPEQPPESTEAG